MKQLLIILIGWTVGVTLGQYSFFSTTETPLAYTYTDGPGPPAKKEDNLRIFDGRVVEFKEPKRGFIDSVNFKEGFMIFTHRNILDPSRLVKTKVYFDEQTEVRQYNALGSGITAAITHRSMLENLQSGEKMTVWYKVRPEKNDLHATLISYTKTE
ncbi:hypothetical protein HYW58_02220 [Candidatus Kaiserbacteria bacterium]|nr:hypothetical protein [Candidatus Kaiserbacteria bacterium]